VAELLGHQRDMQVLGDQSGTDSPDVVVYGISPHSDVARHAPEFQEMASSGAAIVVFCTAPEQAAEYEDLGVEYLIEADEPARDLAAAVRSAYRQRAGRTIH
jgi:hypothetical protein